MGLGFLNLKPRALTLGFLYTYYVPYMYPSGPLESPERRPQGPYEL